MKNFKRILIITLAALLCLAFLALASCDGEGEDTTSGTDNSSSADGTTSVQGPNGDIKAFAFVKGNTTVTPHQNMSEVLDGLGQPLEYQESPSCYYQGLDKDYKYSGFTIRTYPVDGIDYVLNIKFTDDSIETPEGILLGSTADEVVAAYGSDYTEEGGAYVYLKGETELRIVLRDGSVSGIEYWALEDSSET